jgi:hypothetical protein
MSEEFEFETFEEQPSLLETEEAEFRMSTPIVRDHRSAFRPDVRSQPPPMSTRTVWQRPPAPRTFIRPGYTPPQLFRPAYRSWPVVRPGYTPWSYTRPGYTSRPPYYWRQPTRWQPGYRNAPWYWQRRNQNQNPFAPGAGPRDDQIRWIQNFLNRILNQNLPVDGVMSPATRTAVRNFQQRYGLPATGYVGPQTQQALVSTSSDNGMQIDPGGDMTGSAATDQGIDAANSPGGVVVSAPPQNPPAADADARELLEEYGLPTGEFGFESEFENWESALSPEYESDPVSTQSEFEMEGEAPTPQQSAFALVRAIPDDPDYQKYVPLDYSLNAKIAVGEVAQDLKSNGASAHTYIELVHAGIELIEIFELLSGAPALAGTLAVAAPLLSVVAIGYGLGAPYYEIAQGIAENWSATGFSRGVAMGADGRKANLVKDYFGNAYFSNNKFLPNGKSIAAANYRMGLIVGYAQGRRLSKNQRAIFWNDIKRRMGYQSYRGASKGWNRTEWIDWYQTVANIFRRDHLDK